VIKVYRKWILQEKPSFMSEPDKSSQEEEVDEVPQQPPNTEIPNPFPPLVRKTHTHTPNVKEEVGGCKYMATWLQIHSFLNLAV